MYLKFESKNKKYSPSPRTENHLPNLYIIPPAPKTLPNLYIIPPRTENHLPNLYIIPPPPSRPNIYILNKLAFAAQIRLKETSL